MDFQTKRKIERTIRNNGGGFSKCSNCRPENRVGLHRNTQCKDGGSSTNTGVCMRLFVWSHKWKRQPDHKHIEVLEIVLHTCSAYLLWWALSPASLAHPYRAPDIPNSGQVVIGKKSQLTFSLVHPHCLTKLHLQRHRRGSSSNKQTFSKHLFHSCHFWTVPLVIRYIILALPGIRTLHLPVGYLTPCKLRIFFPNHYTTISIIWTRYSSTHMLARSDDTRLI